MNHTHHAQTGERSRLRIPYWLGALVFAGLAAFFLFEEHRAHMLGALPYLLLLACPLLHFGMHGGHGHHGHGDSAAHEDTTTRSVHAGDDLNQGRT